MLHELSVAQALYAFLIAFFLALFLRWLVQQLSAARPYSPPGIPPLRLSDIDIRYRDVWLPVAYWTCVGERPYQEDRYDAMPCTLPSTLHPENSSSTAPNACLYGVFDGHGGSLASEFCKLNMLQCVVGAIRQRMERLMRNDNGAVDKRLDDALHENNIELNNSDEINSVSKITDVGIEERAIANGMIDAFHQINVQFCSTCRLKCYTMGTTSVVALVTLDKIMVANSKFILLLRFILFFFMPFI